MSTPTFKIVPRKDKKDHQNLVPLFLRITKDRKSVLKTLNVKIDLKHWDTKKSAVKKSHPSSVRLNNYLKTQISEYESVYLDQLGTNKSSTAETIKLEAHEKVEFELFTFFREHLRARLEQEKIGTHDKELVVLNKLLEFHSRDELKIQEMTTDFLERFQDHLRNKLGNGDNTINGNLRVIRMLLNKAERLDYISPSDNPFYKFKIVSKKESKRTYLLENEVQAIKDLELNSGTTINHHPHMFLFACYACDIRVSDLLLLKWSNIQSDHLEITTRKTGHQFKFKLLPGAKEILNTYQKITGSDAYILPFFNDVDISTPRS